jgi:hypothetical protein
MNLQFPSNPTLGQLFVGINTVTYQWLGNRWSSAAPMHNGSTLYVYEGGNAFNIFNSLLDNVIDGGNAQ